MTAAKRTIIVIDDDATLNRLLCVQLRASGFDAIGATRWIDAEKRLKDSEPSLVLLDVRLPDVNGLDKIAEIAEICPVVVLTAYGAIDQAVMSVKLGASDYLTKPIGPDALELAIRRALSIATMRRDYEYLRSQVKTAVGKSLLGASASINELRRMIGLVGPSDTNVLILGESGVGKELVAASVHQASERSSGNFVAIDCSTLQESLFESELFGHERGSFTGADRRKEGLIEVAQGGTVFLDEIGELAPTSQAKLLRVIESGFFRRVGGVKDIAANVRFIAATNRDLEAMCREGAFRDDLYYRLSTFVLKAPPLRERIDDIPLLAEHFLQARDFARAPKSWSPGALDALMHYDWPGNVRELRNIVERAALVSGQDKEIRASHLGTLQRKARSRARYTFSFDFAPTLDQFARTYLNRLLDDGDLNRAEIARTMGISERQLYRMLRERG